MRNTGCPELESLVSVHQKALKLSLVIKTAIDDSQSSLAMTDTGRTPSM